MKITCTCCGNVYYEEGSCPKCGEPLKSNNIESNNIYESNYQDDENGKNNINKSNTSSVKQNRKIISKKHLLFITVLFIAFAIIATGVFFVVKLSKTNNYSEWGYNGLYSSYIYENSSNYVIDENTIYYLNKDTGTIDTYDIVTEETQSVFSLENNDEDFNDSDNEFISLNFVDDSLYYIYNGAAYKYDISSNEIKKIQYQLDDNLYFLLVNKKQFISVGYSGVYVGNSDSSNIKCIFDIYEKYPESDFWICGYDINNLYFKAEYYDEINTYIDTIKVSVEDENYEIISTEIEGADVEDNEGFYYDYKINHGSTDSKWHYIVYKDDKMIANLKSGISILGHDKNKLYLYDENRKIFVLNGDELEYINTFNYGYYPVCLHDDILVAINDTNDIISIQLDTQNAEEKDNNSLKKSNEKISLSSHTRINDGYFYYLKRSGESSYHFTDNLYRCDLNGENETCVISINDDYKYYSEEKDICFNNNKLYTLYEKISGDYTAGYYLASVDLNTLEVDLIDLNEISINIFESTIRISNLLLMGMDPDIQLYEVYSNKIIIGCNYNRDGIECVKTFICDLGTMECEDISESILKDNGITSLDDFSNKISVRVISTSENGILLESTLVNNYSESIYDYNYEYSYYFYYFNSNQIEQINYDFSEFDILFENDKNIYYIKYGSDSVDSGGDMYGSSAPSYIVKTSLSNPSNEEVVETLNGHAICMTKNDLLVIYEIIDEATTNIYSCDRDANLKQIVVPNIGDNYSVGLYDNYAIYKISNYDYKYSDSSFDTMSINNLKYYITEVSGNNCYEIVNYTYSLIEY